MRLRSKDGKTYLCERVDNLHGDGAHGKHISLGLPATLTGSKAPGLGVGLSIALPASLTGSEAPWLGISLGKVGGVEGLALDILISTTADDGEDSLSGTLGLPAALAGAETPSLVLGDGVGVALPASLAGAETPGLGGGLGAALLVGGGVVGVLVELVLERELLVEGLGVVLSEGDEVGQLVDVALGHVGGATDLVAPFGGGRSLSETARGVDGLGEGVGGALDLPASLAGAEAPWLGLGLGGGGSHDGRDGDGESGERELHVELTCVKLG